MRKRNTKKALLGSLTMMLLCFALLLGTTFAWFTDTVSSSTATIHSGNLKVALEYALQPEIGKDLDWQDATDSTVDLFGGASWEPGFTGVVYFRVKNLGSLSANTRYNIEMTQNTKGKNNASEEIDLTKCINLGVAAVKEPYAKNDAGKAAAQAVATKTIEQGISTNSGSSTASIVYQSTDDVLLKPKNSTSGNVSGIFAVVVYMPDNTGNNANHNGTDVPSISLKVNLTATQAPSESDAFGSDYDNGATYPTTPTQTQSEEGQSNEGQSGEGRPSGS